MRTLTTDAIVLRRTNYGEADRIITLLTRDYGKLHVIAKGVRKSTSKLAGGIELFSESNIVFIKGRGEIDTLVSTRLKKYYSELATSLDRTDVGYYAIKSLDKATEDSCEQEYYSLLARAFYNLQEVNNDPKLVRAWFLTHLLEQAGHTPELQSDVEDEALAPGSTYEFDFESGRFKSSKDGAFKADHIKLLRLLKSHEPAALMRIKDVSKLIDAVSQLLSRMGEYYLHIKPS